MALEMELLLLPWAKGGGTASCSSVRHSQLLSADTAARVCAQLAAAAVTQRFARGKHDMGYGLYWHRYGVLNIVKFSGITRAAAVTGLYLLFLYGTCSNYQ
jgi:hypothetical protein